MHRCHSHLRFSLTHTHARAREAIGLFDFDKFLNQFYNLIYFFPFIWFSSLFNSFALYLSLSLFLFRYLALSPLLYFLFLNYLIFVVSVNSSRNKIICLCVCLFFISRNRFFCTCKPKSQILLTYFVLLYYYFFIDMTVWV